MPVTQQCSGGGISSDHTGTASSLSISHSTLANNTATNSGGAIWSNGLNATLEQSTLAGNSATWAEGVGGLDIGADHPLTVKGTILANNTPVNCPTSGAAIVDGGYNLDDGSSCGFTSAGTLHADPLLGPLADNGGPTLTFEPTLGSPVINAGDPAYDGALRRHRSARPDARRRRTD